MIEKLLPDYIYKYINSIKDITEIRVRVGTKLVVSSLYGKAYKIDYLVRAVDIERILLNASGGSLYSVTEMINRGYITIDKGIRIGVVGEGVIERGKLISIKNIRHLNIRIPREIEIDLKQIKLSNNPRNTIIISPPGAGKTTLLRALTRYYSDKGNNVLLIDERYELASVKSGKPVLNVGTNTDILSGVPKSIAYEIAIRTMRPDIISTDELYESIETNSLIEAAYSGVKIFATVHANNKQDLLLRKQVKNILDISEQIITLTSNPRAGTIKNIEVL